MESRDSHGPGDLSLEIGVDVLRPNEPCTSCTRLAFGPVNSNQQKVFSL